MDDFVLNPRRQHPHSAVCGSAEKTPFKLPLRSQVPSLHPRQSRIGDQ
jgi:hypothetical protein